MLEMLERDEAKHADDRFVDALSQLFSGSTKPMENLWSHADDVI